jgi:hypothetical protein
MFAFPLSSRALSRRLTRTLHPTSALAHRGLPSRYESGQHLELNNDLATVNYQKASDFGSVDGMYNLAMQFLGQEAGGFAHQFGVRYLEKAVDLNHYPARVALAGCMFTGTGRKGRKDPDRAAQLLTDAAVQVILLPQRCARASPPFLPSLQPIMFPGSHVFGTVVSLGIFHFLVPCTSHLVQWSLTGPPFRPPCLPHALVRPRTHHPSTGSGGGPRPTWTVLRLWTRGDSRPRRRPAMAGQGRCSRARTGWQRFALDRRV